jgi:hypothetical protein
VPTAEWICRLITGLNTGPSSACGQPIRSTIPRFTFFTLDLVYHALREQHCPHCPDIALPHAESHCTARGTSAASACRSNPRRGAARQARGAWRRRPHIEAHSPAGPTLAVAIPPPPHRACPSAPGYYNGWELRPARPHWLDASNVSAVCHVPCFCMMGWLFSGGTKHVAVIMDRYVTPPSAPPLRRPIMQQPALRTRCARVAAMYGTSALDKSIQACSSSSINWRGV